MFKIDQSLFDDLRTRAASSPRRRANTNLHDSYDDPVQRLLIAMEPGSYVKPHRHLEVAKWELFLVLRGRLAALTFDQQGRIEQRMILEPGGAQVGFELPPGVWHTVVALEPSIFFEVKPGPYVAPADKDFAPWAPDEGEARCEAFLRWFAEGGVGTLPPGKVD